MIDGGNHVEILGEKFPACNIQIFDCYPELHIDEDLPVVAFGVYFEMPFESGTNLTICQEAAVIVNGWGESSCPDDEILNHFLVEEYRKDAQTQAPFYAWHCSGEEELLSVLSTLKKNLSAAHFRNVA